MLALHCNNNNYLIPHQVGGLVVLLVTNATGLHGLRVREAHLLVPWLFVYSIGVVSPRILDTTILYKTKVKWEHKSHC